jgi:nucleotide-binding universal stress UspA family protein
VGVGIVAYVIFRKAQGYSLTKTVKSPTLPATITEDVVYDQLLVPVRDTSVSEEMMVLACQLATERKSSIDALYVIEVPLNLPIDASLPEERARAREVLERAASAADMFNVKLTPVVVTARSAGRAIVETAIERRSEVIVLGSQGKRRIADKVFGRTIDYVLNNLPCEAIINVIPKVPAPPAGDGASATSTGMISPTVLPSEKGGRGVAKGGGKGEAAKEDKGDGHGAEVSAETSGRSGVKRRAQGLHLSRYVPQKPPAGNPDFSGDGHDHASRDPEADGHAPEDPTPAAPGAGRGSGPA